MIQTARKAFRHEGVRFLFVGGFAAAVNWLVRFPLSTVMPFEAAVLLAYMIGMTTGFILYRRYVFPGSDRKIGQQIAIFILVNLVGALVVLAVATALLAVQGDWYPLWIKEGLAHGIAIGIGAFANYAGHKLLTFSRRA